MNILHRLCMWAVPVFFMITGALLLNPKKKITYKQCVKKYCGRMLICLFLFGGVFALMKIVMEAGTFRPVMIAQAIGYVFTGESFDHLWYLYALIGIYLILPILKAFVDADESGNNIIYALTVLFILAFAMPLVEGLLDIEIEFYIPLTYTVFYVLLGHYLVSKDEQKLWIDLAVIAAIALLFILMEAFDIKAGVWESYSSPFTAVMAAAIFDAFRHIKAEQGKEKGRLWKADRLCFGAYLIHPVFIHCVYRLLKITPASFGIACWAMTIVFWIMFTACAFIGAWVMSKVPGLKKIVV